MAARMGDGLSGGRTRCRPLTAAYNPAVPPQSTQPSANARVPALSFFFPAHNEAANLEGLVEEALAALPALADEFEIIAVDDGSRDETPQIADRLAAAHEQVRAVHHAVNRGYGAALRSGFAAARYPLICFQDGDRQFKVADLRRLTERMAAADRPDVVVGYRLKRADPLIRLLYARAYRLALRIFYGLRVRDPDCACKLFRREALEGIRLESGGAFMTAELLIKLGQRGRQLVETGVPHYPRTAGSPTGAKPSVVLRAVRDFWSLRLRLWFTRGSALERGEPVLGPADNTTP
jgi:glycosyltransferase involved in cell wall biosynthesis